MSLSTFRLALFHKVLGYIRCWNRIAYVYMDLFCWVRIVYCCYDEYHLSFLIYSQSTQIEQEVVLPRSLLNGLLRNPKREERRSSTLKITKL